MMNQGEIAEQGWQIKKLKQAYLELILRLQISGASHKWDSYQFFL